MKLLALAVCLLAVGFATSTPARADFAVVQFGDGYCQIWWDSAATPWGDGWTKLAIGLPDHDVARAALDSAIMQGLCR
jgi:hypothetical protein